MIASSFAVLYVKYEATSYSSCKVVTIFIVRTVQINKTKIEIVFEFV